MRHINHINHLSGRLHHQKKKKKTKTRTRDNEKKKRQRERDNERRRLFLILPLMVLLSAELMVECFWCVSRGVRGACYKKLSIFSQKRAKNTQKLKTLNIFFVRVQKPLLRFSQRSALLFSLSQKNITKDVFER